MVLTEAGSEIGVGGLSIRREMVDATADTKLFRNHFPAKLANLANRVSRADGAHAQLNAISYINPKCEFPHIEYNKETDPKGRH